MLFKMAAIKRIPVSPEILEELSSLKEPEQTFGELIAGMIEREKKFRLLKDMKRIEETLEVNSGRVSLARGDLKSLRLSSARRKAHFEC
jgi:predicted CopG family antitoxin